MFNICIPDMAKLFDKAFPNITRREHWLAIYIDHRESGANHIEAVSRIQFERQHEVKEPSKAEIEAWRELESSARIVSSSGPLNNGMRDDNALNALYDSLAKLDAIRNPSPAGRWTTQNKTK